MIRLVHPPGVRTTGGLRRHCRGGLSFYDTAGAECLALGGVAACAGISGPHESANSLTTVWAAAAGLSREAWRRCRWPEATAFIVCTAQGINAEQCSLPYLAGWANPASLILIPKPQAQASNNPAPPLPTDSPNLASPFSPQLVWGEKAG